MSNKKLQEALNDPIGKARNSTGTLTKLFWMLINEYGIKHMHWKRTLRTYVSNPHNVNVQSPSRRTEARSNLISALTANETSWLQCIRGFKAMDFRKIRITIVAYRGDAMVKKTVSLDVPLDGINISQEKSTDE